MGIEKPAASRQPMTESRWPRVAGPGEVRALMLIAQGCCAKTARVDSARFCMAGRHSSPARGVENSE